MNEGGKEVIPSISSHVSLLAGWYILGKGSYRLNLS